MNLMFHEVLKRFEAEGLLPKIMPAFSLSRFATRVENEFYDLTKGLYRNTSDSNSISLEGNLFALLWRFGRATDRLWRTLSHHELWGTRNDIGIPGFATYPDYPCEQVELCVLAAGLRHYHDSAYWTWLIALSAEVSFKMNMGKEGERIIEKLHVLVDQDCAIMEAWRVVDDDLIPFRSCMHRSGAECSWGAAYILTAVSG